jgi:DNA polymerase IIIc chi subunit
MKRRSYLVALVAWSCHHVWVEADNEHHAETLAEELWAEDDTSFSHKDGGIDSVTVLESRQVRS